MQEDGNQPKRYTIGDKMVRIKTTNVVKDEDEKITIRTVKCPICQTFLKGVGGSVVVMRCWYCSGEFKIQQDQSKHEYPEDTDIEKHIIRR